ncbi:unnamed protein product [Ilex paraguariensis]|uniref:Uncharacterized protein n=1 Tax=Ilex paraguariensis TaxID=185542 RepID=A0ABC8SJU0_9AQUA
MPSVGLHIAYLQWLVHLLLGAKQEEFSSEFMLNTLSLPFLVTHAQGYVSQLTNTLGSVSHQLVTISAPAPSSVILSAAKVPSSCLQRILPLAINALSQGQSC